MIRIILFSNVIIIIIIIKDNEREKAEIFTTQWLSIFCEHLPRAFNDSSIDIR